MLKLGFGFDFPDLYSTAGLSRLYDAFCAWLSHTDSALASRLAAARADPQRLSRLDESELLVAVAPHVEDWLAQLFGIETEVTRMQAAQHELAPLYACKRQVVQRKAMNKYKADEAAAFDADALRAELEARIGEPLSDLSGELAYARQVGEWALDEAAHASDIDLALRYAAWAAHTPPEGRPIQVTAQARLHAPDSGRARKARWHRILAASRRQAPASRRLR